MFPVNLALATFFCVAAANGSLIVRNNDTAPSAPLVVNFDICTQPPTGLRNRLVDAVVTTADKSTYAFAGPYYWKLGNSIIEATYPRLIANDWKGLPTSGLDTAVTWQNITYFFKDGLYWRFKNQKSLDLYPAPMSVEFPGIPKEIDAAVVWSGNTQLYFFKGVQYWQFKFDEQRHIASIPNGYPSSIRQNWKGVQIPVDVATQWTNGQTYLFSGMGYTRYNDQTDRIDKGYPMSILKEWFGCGPAINATTISPPPIAYAQADYVLKLNKNIAPGVDHGFVRNVSSVEECSQICLEAAKSGCKAFVLNVDGQQPGDERTCWLKSITEPLIDDFRAATVVGIKKAQI